MSFALEPHDGLVKLTLVHDQLPSQQAANEFREGWPPILSSLKTFLETGKPLPLQLGLSLVHHMYCIVCHLLALKGEQMTHDTVSVPRCRTSWVGCPVGQGQAKAL